MRSAPLASLDPDEGDANLDHDAVFNGLLLAVIGRRRLLVLVGEDQGERVSLLGRLARHIEIDGSLVMTVTSSPGVTVEDLVEVAGRTYLGPTSATLEFDQLVDTLEDRLERAGTGILMVEDADKLSLETLRDLVDLTGEVSGSGRFMQVLVAGGPVLEQRLDQADLLPTLRAVGTLYRLDSRPQPPSRGFPTNRPQQAEPGRGHQPQRGVVRMAEERDVRLNPDRPPPLLRTMEGRQDFRAQASPYRHQAEPSRRGTAVWFGIAGLCLAAAGGVYFLGDRNLDDLRSAAQELTGRAPNRTVEVPAPLPGAPVDGPSIPAEPLPPPQASTGPVGQPAADPGDVALAVPPPPPPQTPEMDGTGPEAAEPAVQGPKAPTEPVTPRAKENAPLLADLVEKAERQIDERQFVTPKGDNAMETIDAIVALDPEHPSAGMLKARMVESYRVWGRNAERRGEWEYARLYYQRALRIDPADQQVTNLLDSLDNRRRGGRVARDDGPRNAAKPTPARAERAPPKAEKPPARPAPAPAEEDVATRILRTLPRETTPESPPADEPPLPTLRP
ncbi:hypothetical protein HHL28_05390 [Aerophototrophica crusticola]|uniref:ORC1/DEAH AAA+ ATPase domain-containing protein n=1 Tax=Aerophototrophica crusticola TaxID=1709002 RepID=A0A858R5F9_9PROT|nr:hypothetical protein HHL28_05390 [Rhodospirillaceae bacterium B3]